jgi:hypothetical protein
MVGGMIYRCASALLRGFYTPGVGRFVIGGEDFVVDLGVDIFRIYEGSVDVEDASPDWGKMWDHRGGGLRHGHFRE